MSAYALLDSNNIVVNVIVADETYVPEEGYSVVKILVPHLGYIWNGEDFILPQAE